MVNESDCIEHIELHKPSILVTTHTVKKSHPALSWALDNSIPVINRAELLAYYTNNKITIGITGSHGKTSTTALIGHIFNVAQKNSSIFVGGFMHSIDSNIVTQSSPLIILEADDAYKSFLHLTPHTSVITSIGYEHLETYTDWNDIYNSFLQYALQTKEEGHVVLNAECQHVRKIAPLCQKNVILCGFSPSYDFSASITTENSFYTNVNFYEKGIYTISCQLPFIGKHMIGNAITAYAVARLHNIDQEAIKKGLESHKGVERRFQSLGFFKGHKVFDDYGHHPT